MCLWYLRRVRKIAKRLVASSCLSVRLSVRMVQLGSHSTDFHEILYPSVFRKTIDKIQVSLHSDENNGYFNMKTIYIPDHISLNESWNDVSHKSCRGNQNTQIAFTNLLFEHCTVYEILWKNIVGRGRPQMTIWCMRIACWIIKTIHTFTIRNAYCFSTAKVVARTRLNVMCIRTLPTFLFLTTVMPSPVSILERVSVVDAS